VTAGRRDVLDVTAGMPEQRLEAGEVLFGQGDGDGRSVAVLVEGALRVELDGVHLSDVTTPGGFVGEIAALLGTARTAAVVATRPSTVRIIGDPDAFFASHPQIGLELARQLAGRLHRLLAYLGDVRSQYADADGHLTLIDSVLGRLASRPHVEIEPGSDRSPDY
jgi:CRP/FNR family transcriptional regulator, cyclic AMP receptor protein